MVGWLVSYPCHPVVLAADNRSVSADYVWALRAELEAQAPGSVAVFLPGTCGNVNNGHPAEASYTSAPLAGRTFAEAERIGRHLARTALAAPTSEVDVAGAVEVRQATVELALAPLDTEPPQTLAEHWTAELAGAEPGRAALLRAWLQWARQRSDGEPWPTRRSSRRCAGAASGWSESRASRSCPSPTVLRQRVDGPVLVTGYTGDCPGYLPDAEAYATGAMRSPTPIGTTGCRRRSPAAVPSACSTWRVDWCRRHEWPREREGTVRRRATDHHPAGSAARRLARNGVASLLPPGAAPARDRRPRPRGGSGSGLRSRTGTPGRCPPDGRAPSGSSSPTSPTRSSRR